MTEYLILHKVADLCVQVFPQLFAGVVVPYQVVLKLRGTLKIERCDGNETLECWQVIGKCLCLK